MNVDRICQASTRPDGASGGAQCRRFARPGYRTCSQHAHLEQAIPFRQAWSMIGHVKDVQRNKGDEAAARLVRQAQTLMRDAGRERDADELPEFVPASVRRLI